jgi:hypothetical protein
MIVLVARFAIRCRRVLSFTSLRVPPATRHDRESRGVDSDIWGEA